MRAIFVKIEIRKLDENPESEYDGAYNQRKGEEISSCWVEEIG